MAGESLVISSPFLKTPLIRYISGDSAFHAHAQPAPQLSWL
jgi:hypothetical protein